MIYLENDLTILDPFSEFVLRVYYDIRGYPDAFSFDKTPTEILAEIRTNSKNSLFFYCKIISLHFFYIFLKVHKKKPLNFLNVQPLSKKKDYHILHKQENSVFFDFIVDPNVFHEQEICFDM